MAVAEAVEPNRATTKAPPPAIRARALTKKYGDFTAVDSHDLTIQHHAGFGFGNHGLMFGNRLRPQRGDVAGSR